VILWYQGVLMSNRPILYNNSNSIDTKISFKSRVLLDLLEKYVNGSIIQQYRIQYIIEYMHNEHKERAEKFKRGEHVSPGVNSSLMQTLFMDVHFYLICFDKVQNLIKKLSKVEKHPELKKFWQELEPKFKPYNDMRNNLEHIEERLTSENLIDFGNLNDNNYSFGGKKIDIGEDSLNFIRDSYEHVHDILGLPLNAYDRYHDI